MTSALCHKVSGKTAKFLVHPPFPRNLATVTIAARTMSSTYFHYGATPEASRAVLEQIEQQFRLSKADLMRITSQFLKDFELGLGEYNHPMAMMYVPHYLS